MYSYPDHQQVNITHKIYTSYSTVMLLNEDIYAKSEIISAKEGSCWKKNVPLKLPGMKRYEMDLLCWLYLRLSGCLVCSLHLEKKVKANVKPTRREVSQLSELEKGKTPKNPRSTASRMKLRPWRLPSRRSQPWLHA